MLPEAMHARRLVLYTLIIFKLGMWAGAGMMLLYWSAR